MHYLLTNHSRTHIESAAVKQHLLLILWQLFPAANWFCSFFVFFSHWDSFRQVLALANFQSPLVGELLKICCTETVELVWRTRSSFDHWYILFTRFSPDILHWGALGKFRFNEWKILQRGPWWIVRKVILMSLQLKIQNHLTERRVEYDTSSHYVWIENICLVMSCCINKRYLLL